MRSSSSDSLSTVFAALADPTRRAILARLTTGEATVTELAERFGMSAPGMSKHLRVLERAGLVVQGQKAQWRPRRLRVDPLKDVTEWLALYNGFWDESFDRLDDYLTVLREPRKPSWGPGGREREPVELVLHVERVCDAPRARVFRMWTSAERLAAWWGPYGFTATECEVDARPGGRWRTRIHARDGEAHTLFGRFEEVSEPERLVFSWALEEEDGRPSPTTRVTVTFTDEDGRTRLHLHQAVFDTVERRLGHLAGWRECLDKLATAVRSA